MDYRVEYSNSSSSGWKRTGKVSGWTVFVIALVAGLLGFFAYYQPNNLGASAVAALAVFTLTIVASLVSWLGIIPVFGPIWYVGIMVWFQKWLFGIIGIQSSWLTELIYTIFFVISWIVTAIVIIFIVVAIIKAIAHAVAG